MKTKLTQVILSVIIFIMPLFSLTGQVIIPLPSQIVSAPGFFYFSGTTKISSDKNTPIPTYLQTYLKQRQTALNANGNANEIVFTVLNQGLSEGYELKISQNKIHVTGNDEKGLF